MKFLRKTLLIAMISACTAWVVQAQSPAPRFTAGLAVGGEGTTFVNNPFNTLISKIYIPGISAELVGRVRIGNHLSVQLAPGYTIRPYRSHRTFIGDSLNPNGTPGPFAGKLVDRQLRSNLHEYRVGMMFYFHLKNTQTGFHIAVGPEVQWNRLKKFEIIMSQDSMQFLNESSDLVKIPMIPSIQVALGYTWALPSGILLQAEPYAKYNPIFVEDGKTLSWGTAGVRMKVMLGRKAEPSN